MGLNKFRKNKRGSGSQKPQLSRKEARKEQRRSKKAKKAEYLNNRKQLRSRLKSGKNSTIDRGKNLSNSKSIRPEGNSPKKPNDDLARRLSKEIELEKKMDLKLKKDMRVQRKRQLLEANKEEDKNIKRLEKQLNLNKRKSKSMPKSFVASGLDYILDICDRDKLQTAANAEKNLYDSGSEFEDDLAIATGKKDNTKLPTKNKKVVKKMVQNDEDNMNSDSEIFGALEGDDESDSDAEFMEEDEYEDDMSHIKMDDDNNTDGGDDDNIDGDHNIYNEDGDDDDDDDIDGNDNIYDEDGDDDDDDHDNIDIDDNSMDDHNNEFNSTKKEPNKTKKKVTFKEISMANFDMDDEFDDDFSDNESENMDEETSSKNITSDKKKIQNKDGIWEDIYGRKRDKHGNVIKENVQKYVPPILREKSGAMSDKKKEELSRLKKQMKGLTNRLAENNMHSIANQIEELYMKNSRNDMNETLTQLYFESIISNVATPERLVIEHAMLIAILHANVGTEVGAHILQNFVKKFDELAATDQPIENKQLDNIILMIVHLYTFKVFSCSLVYDMLSRLCHKFGEKEIELIILILRSVGFILRKDSPIALKELILRAQKLANEATSLKDSSRVKFMLEVLLTIKNNNMSKLPQYDPTHSEHLKKIIKTMIRSGNYITELKISLEDLLKADERGRWWIVGSAWTGGEITQKQSETSQIASLGCEVTQEILELAKKQRMNTANRKNIFCILMTAEDYLDAFEKLLKLGLKGQPEQEIIYVLIDCLLQESDFNPYYALIAGQLCISNRRHQMSIQYCVWDKIKEINHMTDHQITNLAKFLAHLFINKSLPISILKVMQFADMEKKSVRLLRQILLSILMCKEGEEEMLAVFTRVARAKKLEMFREALRLFLHHFVLRNMKKGDDQLTDVKTLTNRITLVDQALASGSKLI